MVSKPALLSSGVRLSGTTAGCLPLTPEFFNEGQADCKAISYIVLRFFLCFERLNDLFTYVLGVGFHSPLLCLKFTVHATATRSSCRPERVWRDGGGVLKPPARRRVDR